MAFSLPPLPYDEQALEPFVSAATLKLHHGAHHKAYVDKLNGLIKGTDFEKQSLEGIIRSSAGAIFNNAAQAWNHTFFWRSLRPKKEGEAVHPLVARFADELKNAAIGVFGSGWAWLVEDAGVVKVATTANADCPIVRGQKPLLVIDVWEHAYYVDYRNRRDLYVAALIDNLLDWEFAERNLHARDTADAR